MGLIELPTYMRPVYVHNTHIYTYPCFHAYRHFRRHMRHT